MLRESTKTTGDGRGRIWGRVDAKQGMESCVEVLAMCVRRYILLRRKYGDDKVAYTEHLCYECLQAQKKHEQEWRYICLGDANFHDKNGYATRRLEEQLSMAPEECQAKKPWNRHCNMDALNMAHFALIGKDTAALKTLDGGTIEACWTAGQSSRNVQETVWKRLGLSDGPGWVTPNWCGSKLARQEPSPWRTCARHAMSCRRLILFRF